MRRDGRGGLAIRTIMIKIPDDVRRLDGPYRPDSFTDEVSFE